MAVDPKRSLALPVLGWVMYDWANSAFALSVMTAFFPVFFKQYWSLGSDPTVTTFRLGIANTIAGLCISFLGPFLGALADAGQSRKRFLLGFMLAGAAATAMLYGVPRGHWGTAMAVFVAANIGFSCANLFYDSLLPEVARPERMNLVSSIGYGIGYLGCAVLFIVNMVMIKNPAAFHLSTPTQSVRATFLTVSVWWVFFSLPLLLLVTEGAGVKTGRSVARVTARALSQLIATLKDLRGARHLWLFLIAYWLYIDGVHTFIRMAADFGLSMGLDTPALLTALLIVQLIAFPSAIAFGWLSTMTGALPAILAGIVTYLFITVVGSFMLKTPGQYTFFAALSGIPLGCLQALSRSYFAQAIPADKAAEYFGFYDLIGKFAVIFGPALVGTVTLAGARMGLASTAASRAGLSSLAVLFLLGGVLLVASDRARKREVANRGL